MLLLLLRHFSPVCLCETPHRWQPTRLPRPWDSPGKNTGVGCHYLLQCVKVKSGSEVSQSCPTLRDPMDCSLPGSSFHGIFQARVLEWVAIAFSGMSFIVEWSWQRKESFTLQIYQYKLSKQKNREKEDWGDRKEQRLRDLRDNSISVDIHVIRIQERGEGDCDR